jgi:hypothetical protein
VKRRKYVIRNLTIVLPPGFAPPSYVEEGGDVVRIENCRFVATPPPPPTVGMDMACLGRMGLLDPAYPAIYFR